MYPYVGITQIRFVGQSDTLTLSLLLQAPHLLFVYEMSSVTRTPKPFTTINYLSTNNPKVQENPSIFCNSRNYCCPPLVARSGKQLFCLFARHHFPLIQISERAPDQPPDQYTADIQRDIKGAIMPSRNRALRPLIKKAPHTDC